MKLEPQEQPVKPVVKVQYQGFTFTQWSNGRYSVAHKKQVRQSPILPFRKFVSYMNSVQFSKDFGTGHRNREFLIELDKVFQSRPNPL